MLVQAQILFSERSGVNLQDEYLYYSNSLFIDSFSHAKGKEINFMSASNLRICSKGHQFYKSSDCPTCPFCEKGKKTGTGFLSVIPAPARRALERESIKTLLKLSKYTEKELLKLHGIGPASIPTLKNALKEKALSFRKK